MNLWSMGTTRNESPVITIEVSRVSEAKKERQVRSKVTVMLTVFVNQRGNVHHEYAPDRQTVIKSTTTSKFSIGCMMQCGISNLCCERWLAAAPRQCPCPLVPPSPDFLPKHQIPQVPQPPYSPDMTLSDIFIFPKVKHYWRGIGFKTQRR
jgi:hypothetical protein